MTDNCELAVIGSLFIKTDKTLPVAASMLRAENFGNEICRKIFELAVEQPYDKPLDYVLIDDVLEQRGCIGVKELIYKSITEGAPVTANIEAYCQAVINQSQRRRLQDAVALVDEGCHLNRDWREMSAELMTQLEEINADSKNGIAKGSMELAHAWADHFEMSLKDPNHNFCPCCFPSIDKALGGGFFRSGLYIIGARPGMGKTTFALNLAEKMAINGRAVLFASLEMNSIQIMAKRIALSGRINYTGLMNGTLSEGLQKIAFNTCADLSERPFYCIDQPGCGVAEIEAAARQIPELKCVMVDYLGLIKPTNLDAKLYEQVTLISKSLKQMAMRLNVPVLVLCQLNRESTRTKSNKPELSDLRDSGAIEQDADGVLLLYRDGYFNNTPEAPQSEIEINIAKHRHAASNVTVKMSWVGSTGQIDELPYSWVKSAEDTKEEQTF